MEAQFLAQDRVREVTMRRLPDGEPRPRPGRGLSAADPERPLRLLSDIGLLGFEDETTTECAREVAGRAPGTAPAAEGVCHVRARRIRIGKTKRGGSIRARIREANPALA